jgi:poly(A) polymerase
LQQRHALDQASTADWPRLQRVLTDDGAAELIMLVAAARQAAGQSLDDVEFCRRVLASPKDEWNPPPLLNGDDLIAAGIPAGKHFKAILEQVRDAQLLGKINTPAEALLWAKELNRGSGGSWN